MSYTCVKLNNDLYLYLKQVNKFLAFVCVIRDDVFGENRGMYSDEYTELFKALISGCFKGIMDYNLTLFKDSVEKILTSSYIQSVNASFSDFNIRKD